MFFKEREIKGVFEIKLKSIKDNRGFFMRSFDDNLFKEAGINSNWLQENHSKSLLKNTIRGLHFILPPYTDGKLIRCIRGKVWDVYIDLRKGSDTYGKWDSIELTEDKHVCLYLPSGFAHGFCTLTDNCEILYKHDTPYQKDFDFGILWNDKDIGINWPVDDPIISEKDKNLISFEKFTINYGGL